MTRKNRLALRAEFVEVLNSTMGGGVFVRWDPLPEHRFEIWKSFHPRTPLRGDRWWAECVDPVPRSGEGYLASQESGKMSVNDSMTMSAPTPE